MAKGIGLIGNFKGKVGNMVGYKLTDSNSGNNQGIRVYQPIVKNPKTAAQAEQRAKLAPINATYRALKMIIDRGNEGLPYGNKSRLAWLKQAFKAEHMPWFVKGAAVEYPVLCRLTKGSLSNPVVLNAGEDVIIIDVTGVATATTTTLGALSLALINAYPSLKSGDQLTFVSVKKGESSIESYVDSIVLDTTSTAALPSFITVDDDNIKVRATEMFAAGAVILSREGVNGEHLRSTESLSMLGDYDQDILEAAAKAAAIESYRSSAAVNADWAEESIQ